MKDNREVLRKYLNKEVKIIATYEKEKMYGKHIRKLFVKAYAEDTNEYIGHMNMNISDFNRRIKFKNGIQYRLVGTVATYIRKDGSESLGLVNITVEKL